MFYIEHTMTDGYIIRTYHKEGDSLPTTEMIQQDYKNGFIPEWHITIDPDRRMAEVTFESMSLYETVGTCHCEEVSWINAVTGSNHNYEDVKEYQIQPEDVCRNGKPINECTCC